MGKEFTDLFKSDPPKISETEDNFATQRTLVRCKKTSKAKWQKLLKVNVLLDDEQKDLLDSLARVAMRSRTNGSERITANTFLRCLTDLLKVRASKLDLADIDNEESLRKRLSDLLTK